MGILAPLPSTWWHCRHSGARPGASWAWTLPRTAGRRCPPSSGPTAFQFHASDSRHLQLLPDVLKGYPSLVQLNCHPFVLQRKVFGPRHAAVCVFGAVLTRRHREVTFVSPPPRLKHLPSGKLWINPDEISGAAS